VGSAMSDEVEFPISGGGVVRLADGTRVDGVLPVFGTATMYAGTSVSMARAAEMMRLYTQPPAPTPLTREQVQAIEDREAESERVRVVNERRVRAAQARGRARGRRMAAEDVEAELEEYRAELLGHLDDGDGMPVEDAEVRESTTDHEDDEGA